LLLGRSDKGQREAESVVRIGAMRYACILVRKLEGKRPFEIYRRRLKGNIKMNLKEMVCEDVNWIHLA